jgi:hypothetical protein
MTIPSHGNQATSIPPTRAVVRAAVRAAALTFCAVVAGAALAQPPAAAPPTIADLAVPLERGSQVAARWSASNASRIEVYAAVGETASPTDVLVARLEGHERRASFPIPASGRQVIRVCAVGSATAPEACLSRALTNVVVRGDDYDPYGLGDWVPEPPVPGTLRAVIADADRGSVIGFAADVVRVDVYGVDAVYLNPVDPNDIRPGEGWQDAHVIIDRDLVISGRPDAPVEILARSGCVGCPQERALTYRSRVLRVLEGVTAELEHLTLGGGAFVFEGAGIRNDGTLTLRGVEVSGNRAWYEGGGVLNGRTGVLTLVDSVVRNNRAATEAVEVGTSFGIRGSSTVLIDIENGGYGGGIFNAVGGVVSIRSGAIEANEAKVSGGGIYNLGTLTLEGTVVRGNVADHTAYPLVGAPFSLGGGVFSDGSLTASAAAFEENRAFDAGGAMALWPNGEATLDNVVFRGNRALAGGAIRHESYRGDADRLRVADVTFEANEVDDVSARELARP